MTNEATRLIPEPGMSQRWINWLVVFVGTLAFLLVPQFGLDQIDEIPSDEEFVAGELQYIEFLSRTEARNLDHDEGTDATTVMAFATALPSVLIEPGFDHAWPPRLDEIEQRCRQLLADDPGMDDARLVLGAVHVDQQRFSDALDQADLVLAGRPDLWQAHALRGLALARLDRPEESRLAFAIARESLGLSVVDYSDDEWSNIYHYEPAFEFNPWQGFLNSPGPQLFVRVFRGETLSQRGTFCGAVFGGLFVIAFLSGRRQRREGGGTWRQLFVVSIKVAALWTIPFGVHAVLLCFETVAGPSLSAVACLVPIAAFHTWATLLRPTLSYAGKEALPLSEDDDLQVAVEQIATQCRLQVPRIRVQQAISNLSDASPAFMGGVAPPSIVVYDTFNLMLGQAERRAVLAHEFGHIANHTVWRFALTRVVGLTAAILCMTFTGFASALVTGFVLSSGLLRIMSRWCEFDCDRCAARFTSPAVMRAALRKVHVGHPFGRGAASKLVYATATHPSLDQRLSALCDLDPDCDRDTECDTREVRQAERRSRLAVILWAIALPVLVYASTIESLYWSSFWTLVGVWSVPWLMIMVAARRVAGIERRRTHNRIGWKRSPLNRRIRIVLFLSIIVLSVVVISVDQISDEWGTALAILGVIHLSLLLSLIGAGVTCLFHRNRFRRDRKLEPQLLAAIQRAEYDEVLRLTDDKPGLTGRNGHYSVRHMVAIACMATGDRQRASEMFASLQEDFPGFPMPAILLAMICLNERQPEKALESALRARPELHADDWLSYQMASRALRQLGRTEDAIRESREAFQRGPDEAAVIAQQALLELDAGRADECDRLLAIASGLLEADPVLRAARAERAITRGELETARRELDELRDLMSELPLIQIHGEIERLEAMILNLTDVHVV